MNLPTRSRLQSCTSRLLDVRPSRVVTVGDRSFSTAVYHGSAWNSQPEDVQSASSLAIFRRQSHSDIILYSSIATVDLEVT